MKSTLIMILCESTQTPLETVELFYEYWRPWLHSLSASYESFTPSTDEEGGRLCYGHALVILLLPLWFVCDCCRHRGCCFSFCGFVLSVVHSTGAKLVDSVGIHPINPALIEVNKEDNICGSRKKLWCKCIKKVSETISLFLKENVSQFWS